MYILLVFLTDRKCCTLGRPIISSRHTPYVFDLFSSQFCAVGPNTYTQSPRRMCGCVFCWIYFVLKFFLLLCFTIFWFKNSLLTLFVLGFKSIRSVYGVCVYWRLLWGNVRSSSICIYCCGFYQSMIASCCYTFSFDGKKEDKTL